MKVLQFKLPGESPVSRTQVSPMLRTKEDEELGVRSLRLPRYIWEALDKDAKRCRRSPVRQIEAILVRYYNLDPSVELNEPALDAVSEVVSHKPRSKAAR